MENMSFEQALKRIDEIVKHLERGDAALEQSLALFEEGTALIRSCGKMLDEAEQKVVKLRKGEDGAPVELPFDEEE
ncbi:MAG: exodeoxyribonuclease VII small subunit [Oscillospiraceae bacterium]|nr:exodeoxyribonuclease VII small subunit [Oscillospiraceae bacterium]MBQ9858364.1 exodeoxyribonuclease VII small subunit [Oscillospiraceae bacterium]